MKALPWSHTALNQFLTCPKQFSEIRVYKRFKEEPNEAATWGNWIHEEIDKFFKTREPIHENLKPYWPQIEAAVQWAGGHGVRPGAPDSRGRQIMSEYKMAISTKMQRTDWFADDVWTRAIADLLIFDEHRAYAIDWKTGKVKPDSRQLKLFAVFVFIHFPWVTEVHTSFEWLQHGTVTRETFYLVDVPAIWQSMMPDLRALKEAFDTETWQAKPSGLCAGYCCITTCKHWKPKR